LEVPIYFFIYLLHISSAAGIYIVERSWAFVKKRVFMILLLIAGWTSYSDLTSGSLPADEADSSAVQTQQKRQKAAIPFRRITVSPGDTLLSVTEQISQQLPAIDTVVDDFSVLNPSVDPNHLQIGATYAFPYYGKSTATSK
jgi:hypothetical protein